MTGKKESSTSTAELLKMTETGESVDDTGIKVEEKDPFGEIKIENVTKLTEEDYENIDKQQEMEGEEGSVSRSNFLESGIFYGNIHQQIKGVHCPEVEERSDKGQILSKGHTKKAKKPAVVMSRQRHRGHACSECEKWLSSKNALYIHIKTVHRRIRDHKCDFCGAGFLGSSHLKDHIMGVHLNLRHFKCEDCDYGSSIKNNLVRHIKTVHGPGK